MFTRKESLELEGYTDSDWGGCPDTGRSTGGFVFLLGGAAVSWSSRRQTSNALSSCEAEYMAACEAAKEGIWLRETLSQLEQPRSGPVMVKCDSQSAMSLMKNPVLHIRTKHINIQYHYIRETIEKGEVYFVFCRTELMVADSLTKAVPESKVVFCRTQMGVKHT